MNASNSAIERGECSALVTAPIHKQAIAAAGATHPGHTELLAARAGLHQYGRDYAMYFDSPSIRTVLHSVHVPLTEAIAAITSESVAELALLTDREYRRLHGSAPRIAAAGIKAVVITGKLTENLGWFGLSQPVAKMFAAGFFTQTSSDKSRLRR